MKDGLAKVFGFHRPRESLGSPSSATVQRMNVVGREERVNEKVSFPPPPSPTDRPPSGGRRRRKERKVVREEGGGEKMRRKRGVWNPPDLKKNLFPFSVHTILRFLQIFFHLPPPSPSLSVGGRLQRWGAAGEKRISRDRGSLSFRSLGPASDERNVQRVSYS